MSNIDLTTGIKVIGQIPLDPKSYFLTLENMKNLGENNVNAYNYYNGMFAYCVETQKFYIWREDISEENQEKVLDVNFIYPVGASANGIDYGNKPFNFFLYDFSKNDSGGIENDDGSFTHIMYAEDIEGKNISPVRLSTSNFVGYAFNKETKKPSLVPEDYIWMPLIVLEGRDGIDGSNGIDGLDGGDGLQGPIGIGGSPTFFHVAYANDNAGTDFSQHPFDRKWIGTYSDYTLANSNNWEDYNWIEVAGVDGTKGIPGVNAIDGLTYYLHIAYSNSIDGSVDFDLVDSKNKAFIGVLTDLIENDSLTPTDYSWSRILNPNTGIPDGEGTFTWIKFTIKPNGDYPLVDLEEGMIYQGFAFKKETPIESEVYSDYQWHFIYQDPQYVIQNNIIRVDQVDSSGDLNGVVTKESLVAHLQNKGLSVSEREIILFDIGSQDEVPTVPTLNPLILLNLTHSLVQENQVTLDWDPNNDTAITKYDIFYKNNDTGNTLIKNLGNVITDVLTGLIDGTEYDIYIKAYDSLGNVKNSNTVTITTLKTYTPNVPFLSLRGVTDSTVTLKWSMETSFLANRYELYQVGVGKIYDGVLKSFIVEGLTQNTLYEFYLIAYSGLTISNNSDTVQATTLLTVDPPLSTPTLSVIKTTYNSAFLSVAFSVIDSERLYGYILEYAKIGSTQYKPISILKGEALVIDSLAMGTSYQFRAKTVDVDGIMSEYSNIVIGTTLEEKVKISLLLSEMPTEQQVIDGYIRQLTIMDGEPLSEVLIQLNLRVIINLGLTSGSIEFLENITGLGNNIIYSGEVKNITVTLDENGEFRSFFRPIAENPLDNFNLIATIIGATSIIDDVFYTSTTSFIGTDKSEFTQ